MVRQFYRRYFEVIHLDALTVQDEIQFHTRCAARIRGQALQIGATQSGRFFKQEDLVFAPESIEVTGNDNGFLAFLDQLIEMPQLKMPMPVLEGQVDQENRDIVQFQLNDQAFYTLVEIVKTFPFNPRRGAGRRCPVCAKWADTG